jgi:transposase
MELLIERCAGLDVHKASVTATIRVPDQAGGRLQQTRSFRATTAGLVLLGDWLASFGVTVVGMESTGVYWRPVVRHEVPRIRAEGEGLRLRPVAAGR